MLGKKTFIGGLATLALLGGFAVCFAQTTPGGGGGSGGTGGTTPGEKGGATATATEYQLEGKVQKAYGDERVLEVKVVRFLSDVAGPDAAKQGIVIGNPIYIHVAPETMIIDEDGKQLKNTKDDKEGWGELDDNGKRLKLTINPEKHEMRIGEEKDKGAFQVFEARRVEVMKKDKD
jgi:hypothetical protein